MGLGAMKMALMEEYIRVVYGLFARETVETEIEGKQRKIRFLNPEIGLINTDDAIPLHISASGPRGRALTARLAAGWLNFLINIPTALRALDEMRQTWTDAGRGGGDLSSTLFAVGCVLADGEPCNSERAMAQAGPRAAVTLHRFADEALAGLPNASAMPPAAAEAIQGYIDLARTFEPADAPYLIRATTLTATEAELKRRIGDLRDAGYTQLTIQIVPGQEDAIEDWARIFRAFA
jgi:5,10-methylenetetrahydromethanopterin reductase